MVFFPAVTLADKNAATPLRAESARRDLLTSSDRIILQEGGEWALSRKSADKVIERISSAGFNVYMPYVWHGGGSRWLSSLVAPEWTVRGLPFEGGFDPLAYVIDRAHASGIKVYPVFTIALRQMWGNVPSAFLGQFHDAMTPVQAFNIHDPEFAKFITSLVLEVMRKYKIDGIFLDYVRSMGICTNARCSEDYKKNTGSDLFKDKVLYGIDQGAARRISQWNDAALRSIIEPIVAECKKTKTSLPLGVHGGDEPSARLQGRNSIAWLNEGLVDMISCYFDPTMKSNMADMEKLKTRARNSKKIIITVTNYEKKKDTVVPREGNALAQLIWSAYESWPDNPLSIYLYEQLTDAQIVSLRTGPYRRIVGK